MTEQPVPAETPPKLFTVNQWPHPWPTVGSWRHYIFDSNKNGLDDFGVLVRIGTTPKRKKILIDEACFFRWIAAVKAGTVKPERTVYPHKSAIQPSA